MNEHQTAIDISTAPLSFSRVEGARVGIDLCDNDERIFIPESERGRSIVDFAYQRRPGESAAPAGMSVRLANVLRQQKIGLFGDLHGLDYADLRRFKNCGRKTVNELRALVARLLSGPPAVAAIPTEPMSEHQTGIDISTAPLSLSMVEGARAKIDLCYNDEKIVIPDSERGRSIVDFAYQRRPGESAAPAGMSVRLANVLRHQNISLFGDLHGRNYADVRRLKNCGRKTINELRALVARLLSGPPTEVATPTQTPSGDTGFIETLDSIVDTLPQRSREIVVRRFALGIKSIRIADDLAITRERVRQIEEKFVARVRLVHALARLAFESVTKDDLIEFEELWSGQTPPTYSKRFYVAVARTLVIGGYSYVDTERYYSCELKTIVHELQHDDDFIAGRLTLSALWKVVYSGAPALQELEADDLWSRLRSMTGLTVVGETVIGEKPATGRIISALLRGTSGQISIAVLLRQIEMTFALYGETSYFDPPRLRERISRMRGVYLLDQNTISLGLEDPHVAETWQKKAAAYIVAKKRPVSIVHFIRAQPDCPFDVYAMASLLRGDKRVVLVGRRLYASADFEPEGSFRVACLIADAVASSGSPMTRRELLDHVRRHRDLVCGQMENYFPKIQGLHLYTDDIVGMVPLNRQVMLLMLHSEACVQSLLRGREGGSPVQLESIWLPDDGGPDLSTSELKNLVKVSSNWKRVSVEARGGSLFYEVKETR